MKVVVSEDSTSLTYIHITATNAEFEAMQQERSKFEQQGFRVVGDLILDLNIQEHTIFLERKKVS